MNESLNADWSQSFEDADDNFKEGDWSDFGSDTNISDEIEKELVNMDLKQTVIENYEPVVPAKSSKLVPTKNAMKLISKTKTNKKSSSEIMSNEALAETTSVELSRETYRKKSIGRKLGSEFDIKVSKEKQPVQEDFFADMTPKIDTSTKKSSLDAAGVGNNVSGTATDSKPSQNHQAFGVLDTDIGVSALKSALYNFNIN